MLAGCARARMKDSTVEALYFGHPWDRKSDPNRYVSSFQGSKMSTILMFGTAQAVLIRGVPLYKYYTIP